MLTTSPSLDRTKQKNNASLCDVNLCDINLRDVKLCDVSVCVCGVNLCDVKLCDVNLCDVNLCDVNLCDVKLCDVNLCDVNLCDVKLCDVNLCDVNLCGVNLCDVKLCDVNLCDFNLRDVNLCDVNLCDVKLCDVKLCDVNLCDVKLCDVSVRVCDVNLCGVCLCDVNLCNVNLCDFNLCDVNLCDVNLCDVKLCDVNLCDVNLCDVKQCDVSVRVCDVSVRVCDVNLCGDINLHTARRQTRMPARHPHTMFAPPFGTATPNAIYTQQSTKPARQQDIHTKFSHLLLAQLPRTQFTHSKPPNPHARKTSTQNFRSSYWHSYPEHNLHTASRQNRMSAGHQLEIFAAPIGTATPNAIYTEHAAKPECQQDINAKFSQLLLAQLPRTQFTHSKPPNPHARKTSTRKSSGRAAEPKTRQSVHQTPCKCSKSHACRAKAAAKRRSPKRAKAYIRPRASAPSPTPATQKQRQSGGAQNAPKRTSDPAQVLQAPRLPRKSSGRAAEPKTRQSVHQTPCKCSEPHACHAKAAAERRSPKRAKAYIRPRASAPSPTPATQKQRQSGGAQNAPKRRPRASAPSPTPATQKQRKSGGAQNAPKRTSDPVQVLQVPRLPRKSSGRAAEPKTRQSVHQTPCKCSKSHACHAKAAAERRSPKRAKAYIRPRASAPSPTPATQKQRQSGGAQNAPKRTSDPVQVLQAPRLPRKSSGRAAEPKTRQSVHQTPCKCSKSHACHAKAAAERRSPKRAKAYIRPRASAPSPTPATQKQRQSGGAQNAPKRTSDPVQVLQVPRLPRKSSGRAAEPKTRQSVHQTPRKCSKSHACHAKAAAERRSPKRAKAYIRPPAGAASPSLMSSCVMSSCVMSSCVMSSCLMSSCAV